MREQTLSNKPLAVDLYCGLGGWTEGLLAEGFRVVGFDVERHAYGEAKYPAQLVIQDVLTIHGSQFKSAALIVASPPCQEYSYMAMPWSRAKAIAADYRSGKRDVKKLTALFDACFRIQREASEAAGHHIPMVVENVRGAQPWVGRSRWNFGSFHLWGDVPALMPMVRRQSKQRGNFNQTEEGEWNRGDHIGEGQKVPGFRFDGSGRSIQSESVEGTKTVGHVNKRDGHSHTQELTNQAESDGAKGATHANTIANGDGTKFTLKKQGQQGMRDPIASAASKSHARKAASAMIAKIPLTLSQHIAKVYHP